MQELLSEKLYNALKEWAEADKKASLLELKEKPLLGILIANIKQNDPKISILLAEWQARASDDYKKHIEQMTDARCDAHLKKAMVSKVQEEIDAVKRANFKACATARFSNGEGGF